MTTKIDDHAAYLSIPTVVKDNYFFNLQKLRGLAALFVLIFHFGPHLNAVPGLAWLYPYTRYGFAGVDIFFVLSGIVIGNSSISAIQRGELPWKFIYRRFSRIYLGYWPALLLTAIVGFLFSTRIFQIYLNHSAVSSCWKVRLQITGCQPLGR